ncbi:MAG: hypothetical protein E3K32_13335 [wastewater metagenome]|nr:hypothetical protein [Candidatus Loosdrechtia aerotolerans]
MQKQARKFDTGKARYALIPPGALEELARVYTMGAMKYEDNDWLRGMDFDRVFSAIQRHLWAFWGGENLDEESGLSHLAHAAWGCFALFEYLRLGLGVDNRHTNM